VSAVDGTDAIAALPVPPLRAGRFFFFFAPRRARGRHCHSASKLHRRECCSRGTTGLGSPKRRRTTAAP